MFSKKENGKELSLILKKRGCLFGLFEGCNYLRSHVKNNIIRFLYIFLKLALEGKV
jgi:hypothetical protein